jgi:predicted branched-subunit amino acid permease
MMRLYLPHPIRFGIGQNIGVSVKQNSISVGMATGAAGIAFGAVAVADHFTVAQTCFLSLVLFSGASQFSLVGVMSSGGSPLSAILTGSFLGARNGLYGVRMAGILKLSGWRKGVAAQITIDESTGMAIAQKSEADQRTAFWYTGFGVYVFWNLFTLAGALGAKAIGNTSAWGLDVASPAIFCAVLMPRIFGPQEVNGSGLKKQNQKKQKMFYAALLAFIWALAITQIVPAGTPIITSVIIAALLGWKE